MPGARREKRASRPAKLRNGRLLATAPARRRIHANTFASSRYSVLKRLEASGRYVVLGTTYQCSTNSVRPDQFRRRHNCRPRQPTTAVTLSTYCTLSTRKPLLHLKTAIRYCADGFLGKYASVAGHRQLFEPWCRAQSEARSEHAGFRCGSRDIEMTCNFADRTVLLHPDLHHIAKGARQFANCS